MSVSDGRPLDLGLSSDAVFYITVSSVYFCAKLLLHTFIQHSFSKMLLYLSSVQFWFPLIKAASIPHDYQSYILLYCCANHRFTSGVIKQTLRSQTNNIFTVNTEVNAQLISLKYHFKYIQRFQIDKRLQKWNQLRCNIIHTQFNYPRLNRVKLCARNTEA